MITDDVFAAFLKCPTKSYLENSGCPGVLSEFIDWNLQRERRYRAECQARWDSECESLESLTSLPLIETLKSQRYPLLINSVVQVDGFRSSIDALEQICLGARRKRQQYIPIRMIPREKLTREDKCLLAFDALTLSRAVGKVPEFGKIVHGNDFRMLRVKFDSLMRITRSMVDKLVSQQASDKPPEPVLNKHCPECKFRLRCRKVAEARNDLSLLSKMSAAERERLRNKGIFSVRQLSYTFKPRRRPKHLSFIPDNYSHALKALAIREQKIHVTGAPQLEAQGTRIFLDVEGIPDHDCCYLIGVRIRSGESCTQHSFWADQTSGEKVICASLIEVLAKHEGAQLICYGSYEKSFLRRMMKLYPELFAGSPGFDSLIERATNVLQTIYAHIYFPTYSNGLKEIATYLGFRWSHDNASALDSIVWRLRWEMSKDQELKERLITYNSDDCAALELVFNTIIRLQAGGDLNGASNSFVEVESLKDLDSLKYRKNIFELPDLEYINGAAYWNYQRSKIYLRTTRRLKHLNRPTASTSSVRFPFNKIVVDSSPLPAKCPRCGGEKIHRYGWLSNRVWDLKFSTRGIKRWIVKFCHPRLCCASCRSTFSPSKRHSPDGKYGPGFMAYLLYNLIDVQISQAAVARTLNQFFGFRFRRANIRFVKSRAALYYEKAYRQILDRLAHGKLIHVDETKIRLQGREAFVWVFASFEDVAYVYSDTREAATPQKMLGDFRGVMVTDFYSAYDSIECRQQKCLIHLIRDLNDDLRRNPFNAEIQGLVKSFAVLLRPMIETIDRYGLKVRYLRKYLRSVGRFYKLLAQCDYQTELAVKYRKRFEKNRTSLFHIPRT
ncbi:MAG TPA: TM0106 family RecB-like putative nuclease [Terriglobia bacterium]|nr:TM0106 family RecB-like putative nuclease [Terriglobia bacterium]